MRSMFAAVHRLTKVVPWMWVLALGPRYEPALAQAGDTAAGAGSGVVGTSGASAVRPINASERWFDGATFGVGGSYDVLTSRTADRFRAPHLGVVLSYAERVRGPWSGGVGLWLGDWDAKTEAVDAVPDNDDVPGRLAPLRMMTHVEFAPGRLPHAGPGIRAALGGWFVPFLFGGVGYLAFFRNRAWPPERAEEVEGEAAIRFGTGLRVAVPEAIAFQVAAERWRGVKTFDYSAWAVTVTAEFGDVLVR